MCSFTHSRLALLFFPHHEESCLLILPLASECSCAELRSEDSSRAGVSELHRSVIATGQRESKAVCRYCTCSMLTATEHTPTGQIQDPGAHGGMDGDVFKQSRLWHYGASLYEAEDEQ